MNLRVVPRSGIGEFRNGEAVDDIEQRDLPSVTEKRETFSSAIEQRLLQNQTEKTSSVTADHVVVNYHRVTREYLPRTNDHEVAQHRVVALITKWRRPSSGVGGTRPTITL